MITNILSDKSLLSDQISRKYTDILKSAFSILFVSLYGFIIDFDKTFFALLGFWLFGFIGWFCGFLLGVYELKNKKSVKKN
jgi:hypothetical protein